MTDRPPTENRSPTAGGPADQIRTETQSIESAAEPDAVVAFLADPRHVPDWAPAFADRVAGDAQSGWTATKDGRDFSLRVPVSVDARTVDYLREIGPGREGGAFLRAVPRPGGGSVIVMTLPLLPDVKPADTAAALADELNELARLLAQRH
jgi:Polyketide cyclase / dehydrase and lipid transport